MAEGLSSKMLMEHKDAQGQIMFTSRAWRRLFDIRGPLVHEFILEFFSTFRFGEAVLDLDTTAGFGIYWAESARQIPDKGDLSAYWIEISLIACNIAGRSQAPEKVTTTDLFYLRGMGVGSVNVPYLLARYLRLFTLGRKQGVMISGGQFVTRLVAPRPERQPNAIVGALEAVEDAPIADEGALAVPAPVQAPQPPPPAVGPTRTMGQRLARVEEDVHKI
ncbi:hypothetical protein Tco_0598154 [Tanacetum coccineum]